MAASLRLDITSIGIATTPKKGKEGKGTEGKRGKERDHKSCTMGTGRDLCITFVLLFVVQHQHLACVNGWMSLEQPRLGVLRPQRNELTTSGRGGQWQGVCQSQCTGGSVISKTALGCSSGSPDSPSTTVRRLSVHGVSVSPQGFVIILSVPNGGFWPVRVTSNPDDESSATSAEALTILQLIGGVDMAGPILPPDVLSQIAILQSEKEEHQTPGDVVAKEIREYVQPSLPEGVSSYTEAHPWFRSRVKLPQVTLDEVQLHPLKLHCKARGIGSFEVVLTDDILQEVCYEYDDKASRNFVTFALALRYMAPIEVVGEPDMKTQSLVIDVVKTEEDLGRLFPLFKSANNLVESSQRVTKNIERGFEYNKLSGALRIATERGDYAAAQRIQEQLDKFDSLDDLPTLENDGDDLDSMQ